MVLPRYNYSTVFFSENMALFLSLKFVIKDHRVLPIAPFHQVKRNILVSTFVHKPV